MAERSTTVERFFERLLDAAPDAMVVTDGSGTIRSANGQVEDLFGYSRERLLGASVEMLIPERFRALHRSGRAAWTQQPARRTLGAEQVDLTGLRSDGSEFAVEIRVSPLET